MLQDDINLTAIRRTRYSPDLTSVSAKDAWRTIRWRDRLLPRAIVPANGQVGKTGVILDVETPGLDQQKDEIIELGMVKFDYLPDGSIGGVRDIFTSFNEPSGPIPAEVTALTVNSRHKTRRGCECASRLGCAAVIGQCFT
jgi:DNA polymerase-3 subunit epsilon